jgi:hypothetical protein
MGEGDAESLDALEISVNIGAGEGKIGRRGKDGHAIGLAHKQSKPQEVCLGRCLLEKDGASKWTQPA